MQQAEGIVPNIAMLEKHQLSQSVRVHVYETAADLPSGLELFISNTIKILPWVLLGVGALAICILVFFACRYIIRTYRHTEKFWDKFIATSSALFLAAAGIVYVNFNPANVYFAQNTLEVTIIKDQSLTGSTNNLLHVKRNWVNGYDVALAAQPLERIVSPNTAFAATNSTSGDIEMSFQLPSGAMLEELPNDLSFINANTSNQQSADKYQVILTATEDTEPGLYGVDIDWVTSQRDSMISVSKAQSLIDASSDNALVTESGIEYFNTVGPYFSSDDTPTEEMYRKDCNRDHVLSEFGYDTSSDERRQATEESAKERCGRSKYPKFHHWLNAPYPIYRQNIKSISFVDGRPANAPSQDPAAGRYCWDISERQTGQVMACATRRPNIEVQVEDISGLGVGNSVTDRFQDVLDILGGGTMLTLPQPLYDIEIGQDGGVNAPINSSYLFYYAGQNTDYFIDGRMLIPRADSRAWYDQFSLQDSINVPNIPIIGALEGIRLRILDGVIDVGENVVIQTKICAYNRYFAYGPQDNPNDCAASNLNPTTINLNNFIVNNVTNMRSMFEGANFNNLSDSIPDSFRNNTGKVENMKLMFATANDMADWRGDGFDTSNVKDFEGMFSGARFGKCNYVDGDICDNDDTDVYDGGKCQEDQHVCGIDASTLDTEQAETMRSMFADTREAHTVDVSGFNTSNTTNMSWMFLATASKELDLASFDTSKVTTMEGMFSGTKLESLDISNFDTKEVLNMTRMFENLFNYNESNGGTLDLKAFDTSSVTDMTGMFSGSNITSLDLTNFDTSNVTIMRDMFFSLGRNIQTIDLSSFDTSNVIDMSWMFANVRPEPADAICDEGFDPVASADIDKTALILVPVSNEVMPDQTGLTFRRLGQFAASIIGIPDNQPQCQMDPDNPDMVNLKIAEYSRQISGFSRATLDLRVFNTSNVTTMEGMFAGNKSDLVNFTPAEAVGEGTVGFDTSKVTDMSWMFAGIAYSPITNLPLNTDSAEKMIGMFAGLTNYHDDEGVNISTFEIPEGNEPDMSWMFTSSCISIEVITSQSFKNYVDSIPEDNADRENKGRYMFDLIEETCEDIDREDNYVANRAGLVVR